MLKMAFPASELFLAIPTKCYFIVYLFKGCSRFIKGV